MEPREMQEHLRDLLLGAARPEIAVVRVLPSETLKVLMLDRSEMYVSIPHLGKAGETPPSRPGWPMPSVPDTGQDTVPADARRQASMRPSYFAGLIRHLLDQAGNPAIAGVEPFDQLGVSRDWPPFGIRVNLANGRAIYLSVAKGSATGGIPNEQLPETFTTEEHHADVEMSGVRR